MFQLLDIAYPGRIHHPRIIRTVDPDTVVLQPAPDSVAVPDGVTDSIIPQEIIDTLTNKGEVLDTLRSAINMFNDWGGSSNHSSMMITTLVVVAALTLCGGFVWMYRRNLQQQNRR